MNFASKSRVKRNQNALRSGLASLFALGLIGLCPAHAADKPPLAPDTVVPFSTDSRLSAGIEFSLPALAADIERDIPKRLATSTKRSNACIAGYVLQCQRQLRYLGLCRTVWRVSLYGRGDHVYGSVPIHGVLEGQGANRFTARIHGETEASATIEAAARPQLNKDWSLDLHFSDGFRWNEPPVLHVLGRDIPVAKYAEPQIRTQLAMVRACAGCRPPPRSARQGHDGLAPCVRTRPALGQSNGLAANDAAKCVFCRHARGFRGASRHAGGSRFGADAGRTNPPAVTATPLPLLGDDISAPGAFDVILPDHLGYDVLKEKAAEAMAAMPPVAEISVSDIDVYPSAGKLVIGLRGDKAADPAPMPENGSIYSVRSRPLPTAIRSGSPISPS